MSIGGRQKESLAEQSGTANERAWDYWASLGSVASRPAVNLTPEESRVLVDPDGWLPMANLREVLCLGGGGGQQGPAFARLGCNVTVIDASRAQLELDADVAAKEGLNIQCVQADMSSLAGLPVSGFDLVHQPISSCYVADVRPVHQALRRILRPGGIYRVEHWNPAHMRIWLEGPRVAGTDYLLPSTPPPGLPLVCPVAKGPAGESLLEAWHFPHSLSSLIGSLCDAGFSILRFAEDCGGDAEAPIGTDAHLSSIVPPFFRLMARRTR
jgi:SAM-dependent methyltransferase